VKSKKSVEVMLKAEADVGEGPHWDAARAELTWVDITRCAVHRFDPVTGKDAVVIVDQPVGAAVRCASNNEILLAAETGFARLNWETGQVQSIAQVGSEVADGGRMNDGKCDRAGRFWAGTMTDGDRPEGALYRLDSDHNASKMVDGVRLSNGLAWSPDDKFMYYIDSVTYRLDVFDFFIDSGEIANRRSLIAFPPEWGLPDGMTCDSKGGLWIAFWDGWAVRHFHPDGALIEVIYLPVAQVTSCVFGGRALEDLYVTSARYKLDPKTLAEQPLSGAIFRIDAGVPGLPEPAFAD
jgi:sugar lactone lactonase YvrE